MQIFFETERLRLRRFTDADVDDLFTLHNDPDVMRFLTGGKPTPRDEIEREYDARFARVGYWAAIEQSSGAFLGWFAFHPTEGRAPDEYDLARLSPFGIR